MGGAIDVLDRAGSGSVATNADDANEECPDRVPTDGITALSPALPSAATTATTTATVHGQPAVAGNLLGNRHGLGQDTILRNRVQAEAEAHRFCAGDLLACEQEVRRHFAPRGAWQHKRRPHPRVQAELGKVYRQLGRR